MRDNLYKAKTTPKKKGEFNNVWVEGDLIHSGGKYYIHPKGNKVNIEGELGKIIVMHEVLPETVCQYTGLPDKKKQKIFEGDIVRKRCKGYRGLEIGVIIYDKDAAEFKIKWKATKTIFSAIHMYIDEIEVVGSIFDNPELIEKRWFKWE